MKVNLRNISRAGILGITIGVLATFTIGAYAVTGTLPFVGSSNSGDYSKLEEAVEPSPSYDPKVDTELEEAEKLEERIINSIPTKSEDVRLPKVKLEGQVVGDFFEGLLKVDLNRSNMGISRLVVLIKADGVLEDNSAYIAQFACETCDFEVEISQSTEYPIRLDLQEFRNRMEHPDYRPNGLAVISIDYSNVEVWVYPSFIDPEFGMSGFEGVFTRISMT